METNLQAYVNAQIEASFEYLLMSTHFGNYQVNREGFKSLYRKLSDKAWDDAFDLIKYISKRGGRMNFREMPKYKKTVSWFRSLLCFVSIFFQRSSSLFNAMKQGKELRTLELNELNSLAKALDTQKDLSEESMRIHSVALHHNEKDGSLSHYMEERFMEPQVDCIRNLAGHITDLKQLISDHSAPVSLFIFDEYLQKTV